MIVRSVPAPVDVSTARDGFLATLSGRLAVFDEWAEIDSRWEGHFMERIAPGAFIRTIERDAARYRALFSHGHDPQVAMKPLGPVLALGEDGRSAFYKVGLLETDYNRELLPGLKAGLYGSSFRGEMTGERLDRDARPSEHNPDGLPERTVTEVTLMDFGPTPFPAYVGTTADARSRHAGEAWTPARRRERLLRIR